MSTTPPTEPTPDQPTAAQPTEAYPAPEQPTQAYAAPTAPAYTPPAYPTQPTQAYGAPEQPTQAYPYAQPTAPYGVAPQATGPDTRSKTLAWTALILAIVGIVLALVGFVPVAILGVIAVLIGGLVLLAGFVISIVALVGKRHGGTPLSITALVLSVVGTGIAMVALTISLVFTGLSLAGTSSSTDVLPDTQTSDPATDDGTTDDGTTGDGTTDAGTLSAGEEAFLAEVRPEITQLLMDIDPTVSAEDVESVFPDDALITIGQTLLVTGDAGIDAIVDQTLSTAGDAVDAEQLRSLYEAIYAAAEAHLQ